MDSNAPRQAIPLEALAMSTMASGHQCLNLSQRLAWEDAPLYGEVLADMLGSALKSVADSAVTRIWELTFDDTKLRLVWDDYPYMVSLESSDAAGDSLLNRLRSVLEARRMEQAATTTGS